MNRDASAPLLSLWDALITAQGIADVLPACHIVGPILSTALFRAGIRVAFADVLDPRHIARVLLAASRSVPDPEGAAHLFARREAEALIRADVGGEMPLVEHVKASKRNAFFTAQVATREIFQGLAREGKAQELGRQIVAVGESLTADDWLIGALRGPHPSWSEGIDGLAMGVRALARRMEQR